RPVAVCLDGRREYVRGRIDRVDHIHKPSPQPGGSREPPADAPEEVAVLDYKRSTFPAANAVKELKDMQMPVYLAAARTMPGSKGKVLPAKAFYRSLRSCKGHSSVLDFACEEDYEVFEQEFAQAMFDIVDAVRQGRFPAAPPTGKCSDYCIGRGVCRYNEARVEFLKRGNEQDNA
ncbi:MAG: PD-(D/E)XK nuclease family protein, partial [Planctomycetes bacterium]|nr:PD-(D/E)XK nuclease family protein [Planctomycetota bacterium]